MDLLLYAMAILLVFCEICGLVTFERLVTACSPGPAPLGSNYPVWLRDAKPNGHYFLALR